MRPTVQVDELRETADKICELEVIEKINVSWAQRILAPMLREAADTIWELRNKQAGAENARLHELVRRLVYATHPADRGILLVNVAELGIEVE